MACGGPEILTTTWETLKDGDWTNNGITVGSKLYFWAMDDRGGGALTWEAYEDGTGLPGTWTKCNISEGDWNTIAGGTLNTSQNAISKGGNLYCCFYVEREGVPWVDVDQHP